MQIATTRFGKLTVQPDDSLLFPAGLPGLEDCRKWVLLVGKDEEAVAWLQSMEWPEVALPLISPRRYVPDYCLTADRSQLDRLGLQRWQDAEVLAVVSRGEQGLTLNLKAPVVISRPRRLGFQILNAADWPISYALTLDPVLVRRSA